MWKSTNKHIMWTWYNTFGWICGLQKRYLWTSYIISLCPDCWFPYIDLKAVLQSASAVSDSNWTNQLHLICSLPEAFVEKYLMLNKQDLRFLSLSHVVEYRQSIRLKSRIRRDLKGRSPGASGQCWCLEVWDGGLPVDFSLKTTMKSWRLL